MATDTMLTVGDVAETLGVSKNTVKGVGEEGAAT